MAGADASESRSSSLFFYKWLTFGSMYVGYTLAVVNRKCFSFALPAIIDTLHLSKDEIGLVSSSQNLAYTISKFCGGILSDNVSAKMLFAVGLFFSGLLTISLTAFQSATAFAVLWFFQGLVQGGGWPACAKIMKQWFHPSEFGTWYSILNTTMNVSCSVGPLLTAFITAFSSWQTAVASYGVISLLISLLCYITMWNSPAEVGGTSNVASGETKKDDQGRARGRGTWHDMLRSPFMWLVSASYFVVFLGRTAMLDWAQLYLVQDLGHDSYVGSLFISSLEVGGILGSVSAGFIADRLIALSQQDDVYGSPRLTVVTAFAVVNVLGVHALAFIVGSETSQVFILLVGFIIGFGIYGPVSLYGVMAIEAAPSHLSGTSHAIVSLASNVGAIMAGLPFSYLAKLFEWRGSFIILEAMLVAVVVAKVLMRNVEYKMVPTKKKLQ